MDLHDPENRLVPREQLDLPSRLSASNASFRRLAQERHNRPLIIQKVPQSVRGGLEKRYFVPDVVAIGPYHHRSEHLVEMEEVKEAVAHEFCRSASPPADDAVVEAPPVPRFLEAVTPILPEARSCYSDRFDNITNNEFAYMMVVDGCFLLAVMAILTRDYPKELESLLHLWRP